MGQGWKSAAAALLVGSLLTGGALEIGLRAAGLFVHRGGRAAGSDGVWTVLCLGDSNTYTGGGDSYPDQLSRRLTSGGVRARVVNRGIPGMNSTQLAGTIDGEINRWNPDAVIVLIGADNFWNNLPVIDEPLSHRLDRAMLSLRTWKLIKLLWVGIRDGTLRGHYRAGLSRLSREEALEIVKTEFWRSMSYPEDWYRVQLHDAPSGPRIDAALRVLSEIIAARPDDGAAHAVLGRWALARGDAREAARLFRAGTQGSNCETESFAGLGQALERLDGPRAAQASFGDEAAGGRCPLERRLAEAQWRLWRGEPAVAMRITRAVIGREPERADAWDLLGWSLYAHKDYDGAIAAFMEHARRTPASLQSNSGLKQAWARKWERRGVRRGEEAPREVGNEIPHSWFRAGEYDRCAEASVTALRAEPLDVSGFHLYTICMRLAGRFDEAGRLKEEIPALKDNLMYRYYAAQRLRGEKLRRPLEALLAEQFALDMERIARIARRRGVPLILSSYPDEEYAPVRRTAETWRLPYADLLPVFRARFTRRDDFLAPDRCHPNGKGFAVMAEIYEQLLRKLPGFPVGGAL